jgi:diadenosine tetraphosphate (Ap4A) HIT family hydrolase
MPKDKLQLEINAHVVARVLYRHIKDLPPKEQEQFMSEVVKFIEELQKESSHE